MCHDPKAFYSDTPSLLDASFIEKYQKEDLQEKDNSLISNKNLDNLNAVGATGESEPQGMIEQLISKEVSKVRAAPDSTKHNFLLKSAHLLGGYVGSGEIEEAIAIKALEDAIQPKALDFNTAKKTIRDGIKKGKQKPLTILDLWPYAVYVKVWENYNKEILALMKFFCLIFSVENGSITGKKNFSIPLSKFSKE